MMKFTCAKDTLSEAISICSHAVSAKASTPILEGLLIKVQNGEVTLTGFNYKTGIQRSFAADRCEDGEVVINARILGIVYNCASESSGSYSTKYNKKYYRKYGRSYADARASDNDES